MVSCVQTVAFQGINAKTVDVQVQVANGLPAFNIVGLPDKAVGESKERVRSALTSSGLSLPPKRITVNLAPADLPKEGSHYDVPIAVGLMTAIGAIPADAIEGFIVLGELALDGRLSPVAGTLPAALAAEARGFGLICPEACGPEAAWASEDLNIVAPVNLIALANHLVGTQLCARPGARRREPSGSLPDLSEIRGQETARRALEVAAAGGHNFLMVGPPGAGKSMLAACLPSILPPMTPRELLDVSLVQSIAGELADGRLSDRRPFRSPHHSASMAALIGGGLKLRPGEVSLAHNGVLFLDELPEFSPQVIDGLRQPLESGATVIARANQRITYPSRVQLVAAMNPCKCGMAGSPGHTCRRGDRCATDYQARVSGPFLDRIDIRIDVPSVSALEMISPCVSEPSKSVADRVSRARAIQVDRYLGLGNPSIHSNSAATAKLIEQVTTLDPEGQRLLMQAAEKFSLSARAYHRVLKVSRTIADLAGCTEISRQHIGEALGYRVGVGNRHGSGTVFPGI